MQIRSSLYPLRIVVLMTIIAISIAACGNPLATAPVPTIPPTALAQVTGVSLTSMPTGTPQPTLTPSSTPMSAPTATLPPTTTPTLLPSPLATTTVGAQATAVLSSTAFLTTTSDVSHLLAPQWYVDSNGNGIPDFIETKYGYDPTKENCPMQSCGDGGQGTTYNAKGHNVLLILDSSGSMVAKLDGVQTKLAVAKAALLRFVGVINTAYKLGFMVYGHKGNNTEAGKAESCAGINVLAPLGQVQRATFPQLLDQFQPTGWTPIAASLSKAQQVFAGQEGADNRIILVSDGIETCGGDPVAVATQLHAQGLKVQVDIVGFGVENSSEAAALLQVAQTTGGSYFDAKTYNDFQNYWKQQVAAEIKTEQAAQCELHNTFFAELCQQTLVNHAKDDIYAEVSKVDSAITSAKLKDDQATVQQLEPQEQAYKVIITRIQGVFDAREKRAQEASDRYNQLQQQLYTMQQQFQQAYGSNP